MGGWVDLDMNKTELKEKKMTEEKRPLKWKFKTESVKGDPFK